MVQPPIGDLDASATLVAVSATLGWRRAAEVEDLRLAGHWADLHAVDPRVGIRARGERVPPWTDRLVDVGGPGTPRVLESAVAELAIAHLIHPHAASRLVADALDLRHRLPRTWSVVEELRAEVWVARKVATLTRVLSLDTVGLVDAAVADAIGSESPARVLDLTRAKVIEADPQTHTAAVEAEKRRRYAALGRTDAHGLRLLIARVTAGDAAWIDATLERVADLLTARHTAQRTARHPVTPTRDELRSEALGWLARPAELLTLLLESTQAEDAGQSRATAFPADLLETLRSLDPVKLRPRTTLYVHLHEAALTGPTPGPTPDPTPGVARVEGIGPYALTQLRDLLAHTHVTIKP
ncbi:MAG: hypothetical protein ABIQ15_17250, partial [Nocardioides sp.]